MDTNINNESCMGCLCRDESLIKITDVNELQFYLDIVGETKKNPKSMGETQQNISQMLLEMCVECTENIKHCVQFRDQVKRSYDYLASLTEKNVFSVSSDSEEDLKDPLATVKKRKKKPVLRKKQNKLVEDAILTTEESLPDKQDGLIEIEIDINGTNTEDSSNNMRIPELLDGKHKSVPPKRQGKMKHKSVPKKKRKTKVKKPVPIYKGISTVKLSVAEMSAERERARMKPAYLKLPYKCEDCVMGFDYEINLQNHRERQHAQKPDAFTCDICKSVLKNEATFKAHTKLHYIRYACDECGQRYQLRRALQEHINYYHLHIRQHECDQCGKTYMNKLLLERHRRGVHEKQRPPRDKICHHCGRAFNSNQLLGAHIRSHTGERPYRCARCPADFAHKAALYTHTKLRHLRRPLPTVKCSEEKK